MFDVEKIQRVGKLAGELLHSGRARDSQEAMRAAENMLLKQHESHLTSPFMNLSASAFPGREKPKEEEVDYSIILRKFTTIVDDQKREIESLKAMIVRLQKEVQEIKSTPPPVHKLPVRAPHASSSASSAHLFSASPSSFEEHVSVSHSVPPPGAPTRRNVPIIGPDGKPVQVEPVTSGENPRSGGYTPRDVSIEKFFYSGGRKK